MTVSRDFSLLNSLRPTDACFGEVVGISLSLGADPIGFSKRKSIHVPPSSNAFWNWKNLQADLTAFHNARGYSRADRLSMNRLLNLAVRMVHHNELVACYPDNETPGFYTAYQYYEVTLDRDIFGWFVVVHGSLWPQGHTEVGHIR